MSRVAPTSGSKALYFLCITLSAFLLYLDINYKSFERAKNLYKSFTISSSYLVKRITIDPFSYIYKISKEKTKLIEENKKLKILNGKTQINLFFENSTRTLSSFELAGKRLGADVMNMNVAQ